MSAKVPFVKMLCVLTLFCVCSGALLAWVYVVTERPIAEAARDARLKAMSAVLPEYDNDPLAQSVSLGLPGEAEMLRAYPAMKGDSIVGIAVQSYSSSGFSGRIDVMVGFAPDGTLIDYSVVSHSETPGLGAKMDSWFRSPVGARSVIGLNPACGDFRVTKDGGSIDGITAATISSRAFLDAVRRAYSAAFEGGRIKISGR